MVSKGRHQDSVVAGAIDDAKKAGLTVEYFKHRHRWGWIICAPCGMRMAVAGTPKNPGNEAKRIRRFTLTHQDH